MKTAIFLSAVLTFVLLPAYGQGIHDNIPKDANADHPITGKWVRMGPSGPVGLNFKQNDLVEADFGNDGTTDVVSGYQMNGDTIRFIDKEGNMCPGAGLYKTHLTDYYLALDLIDDDCSGRINMTMGFWTKPDFEDLIAKLDQKIASSPTPESYLNRARIYLAIGMPEQAREDFDHFISEETATARVYVNRASTRFPDDLEGVVSDCNKALSLDPNHKNAYFLRGLARYELGNKAQGCEDFTRAIELGFSVLRIAEQEKCAPFWDEE